MTDPYGMGGLGRTISMTAAFRHDGSAICAYSIIQPRDGSGAPSCFVHCWTAWDGAAWTPSGMLYDWAPVKNPPVGEDVYAGDDSAFAGVT